MKAEQLTLLISYSCSLSSHRGLEQGIIPVSKKEERKYVKF